MMYSIEDDLKAALRRKPAPPGFTAKVLDRVGDGSFRKKTNRRFLPNRFWAAAAAMIIVSVGLGVFAYQRHIQARNEAALQRTLMAFSIAAEQLEKAEMKAFEPKRWERISKHLRNLPIQKNKKQP
jgi:hypothetical protein